MCRKQKQVFCHIRFQTGGICHQSYDVIKLECAASCMETDACYAVNFRHQNKSNCELTSGMSDDDDMVDDVTSDLYVMGAYILVKTKKKLKKILNKVTDYYREQIELSVTFPCRLQQMCGGTRILPQQRHL